MKRLEDIVPLLKELYKGTEYVLNVALKAPYWEGNKFFEEFSSIYIKHSLKDSDFKPFKHGSLPQDLLFIQYRQEGLIYAEGKLEDYYSDICNGKGDILKKIEDPNSRLTIIQDWLYKND